MGAIISILFLVSALMPIPGGYLADRYDRRKVIFYAWIAWALSPLAYSFATHWLMMIPGTVLWGLSFIGAPALSAYVITSIKDEKKFASVISLVFGTYSLGYVFSPAIGGYLAVNYSMQVVFYLSAIFSGIATCFYLFLTAQHPKKFERETREQSFHMNDDSNAHVLKKKKMIAWVVFYALAVFFMSITRPYTPVFLKEVVFLDEFYVGIFGSVAYLGSTILGITLGIVGDRWKRNRAVTTSLVLYLVATVALILTKDFSLLLLIAFILGGSLMIGSIISSIIGSLSPETGRGRWMATPQTASMLAAFVAPYVGGFLYEESPFYPFIVSVVSMPFLVVLSLAKYLQN
jgi:MFS family permease